MNFTLSSDINRSAKEITSSYICNRHEGLFRLLKAHSILQYFNLHPEQQQLLVFTVGRMGQKGTTNMPCPSWTKPKALCDLRERR